MKYENMFFKLNSNPKVINKKLSFDYIDKRVGLVDINDIIPPKKVKLDREIDDSFISMINEKLLAKELLKFSRVLVYNFSDEDLVTFYNNMWSLTVCKFDELKYNKKNKNRADTLAYYKVANNTIFVSDYISTVFHELFHMSTSKRMGIFLFSGFSFHNLKNKLAIGNGINEGYTQLLSERYFDESIKGNYNYLVYMLTMVENIIGKEKMESLYMSSNLYGLVDELKKYASYKDICRFVTYTDYLLENMYKKNLSNNKLVIIGSMCEFINEFIVKLTISKYKINRPESEDEYYDMVNGIKDIFNKVIAVMRINGTEVDCSFLEDEDFMYELVDDLNELEVDFDVSAKKKVL